VLALIPLLPFVGFLVNAGLGRRLSRGASGATACAAMLGSFAVSVTVFQQLLALEPEARVITQHVFTWISVGRLEAAFSLYLDPLSALMILVVTGIGSLIHVYSTAYMHDETEAEFARYFSYLNLFAAFMLVLVLGSNFLVLFIGWEGVGLCSYLLIGFWYRKPSAVDAGKKAFVVNRVGDFAFIVGVLLIVATFGTIEFADVARLVSQYEVEAAFGTLSIITLLLFIGATGKSAQIPLYVWLPDAMEGPTPVSALIHAATMVTAGVYMIGRNAALFSHAPETLAVVAIVGAATAFLAGTIGLVQTDIKRVLAYSTVSQLGFMFLAMGVGAYTAGIFHLLTHAFFKALLFLGSGAVIHALAGEQDLRRMGGLKAGLPVTYWTFLIGALAIAGVPGLAGFFSKDEILFKTFASGHVWLWVVASISAFFTAIYMFRLVFLAFHGAPVTPGLHPTGHQGHGRAHLHDAPPAMALALVLLAVGSVVVGYLGVPHALGGSNVLEHFLAPSFPDASGIRLQPDSAGETLASESIELGLMALSTAVAVAGIALAAMLFLRRREIADRLAAQWAGLHALLLNKYGVDEFYDRTLVRPVRAFSEEGLWRSFDIAVVDATVASVGDAVTDGAAVLRRLQTGSVRAYAASLVLGAVLILGYWLW
jgi:NADH-quinone oxidoreductase subunit L